MPPPAQVPTVLSTPGVSAGSTALEADVMLKSEK